MAVHDPRPLPGLLPRSGPHPEARALPASGAVRQFCRAALVVAVLSGAGCATVPGTAPVARSPAPPQPATAEALAEAMALQPVVLLGEVHDNAAQHALRAEALRQYLASGPRPAIAFEQIDRDQQDLVDRIRLDTATDVQTRADRIIEQAGAKGWNWPLYRPYIVLALENNLPIVGANLSRNQAMRVATEGMGAVFDAAQRASLGLERIAPDIEKSQEYEIERGHCGQLPADSLPAMAGAQVARDAVLARSISAYFSRGVVLLTGNGHARRDIGVIRHIAARDRPHVVSIGLLEDDDKAAGRTAFFDVTLLTPAQPRDDPCTMLRRGPMLGRPGIGTD